MTWMSAGLSIGVAVAGEMSITQPKMMPQLSHVTEKRQKHQ